jgi:hypothetical protein
MAKATRRSRTRGRPVSKSVRRSRGRPASKSRSTSRRRSRGRSNKKKRRSKKVGGGPPTPTNNNSSSTVSSVGAEAGSTSNVGNIREVEDALTEQEVQKQNLLTLLKQKAREKSVTIPTDGDIDEVIKTLLKNLVENGITQENSPEIQKLLRNPLLSSLRQTDEVKNFLGEAESAL